MLAKTNLKSIEVLISRTLTNLYISHDKFVLVNNVLEEYDVMKMKKEIRDSKTWTVN